MARRYRRIVVPVDFSPGSEAALRAVERLGDGGTIRLHLVHAIDPASVSAGLPPAVWANVLNQLETAGRRQLTLLAVRVRARLGRGARVQAHLEQGPPHHAICRVASRLHADLIVIGTHGRTGLAHIVLGSVAERVVRHAGRPVLTIPIRSRRRR